MLFSKKLFIILSVLTPLIIILPSSVQAQSGIEISPRIINETVFKRDLFDYEISITNNTDRKVELYAVVNEVNADGSQASSTKDLDRAVSLRKWIKITHGVIELMPGESTVKKMEIKVSPYALPGQRYAAISIVNAPDRYAAERKAKGRDFGQIFLSYNVKENIVEKAQITKFETTKNIYIKPNIGFDLALSNFGNRDIFPLGKIYIFDRRGQVVAELEVNSDNKSLSPGAEISELINWTDLGGVGKYKAKVEIKYGQNEFELMDTIYFWYLPWMILAGFIGVLFLLLLILLIILFKKGFTHHDVQGSHSHPHANGPGVINLKK